ncbi:hypothetical protein ACVBEQ_12790 [Nakamurella sp. GG22]
MSIPGPDDERPVEPSAVNPDLGDTGGDPVCWAPRVCPECGLFVPVEPPTTCPRCGTTVGVD